MESKNILTISRSATIPATLSKLPSRNTQLHIIPSRFQHTPSQTHSPAASGGRNCRFRKPEEEKVRSMSTFRLWSACLNGKCRYAG